MGEQSRQSLLKSWTRFRRYRNVGPMRRRSCRQSVEALEDRTLLAFSVVAAEVAAGMQFHVDFDGPVDAGTLDAADLVIDGSLPATSVILVDAHRAVFTLPSLADGSHTAEIAAGTIQNTSAEGTDAVSHPFTLGAEAEYSVKHNPRLQLGDAPLSGFAGGDLDQIEVLWQTVSAGEGSQDEFQVEYRLSGSGNPWSSATNVSQIATGVDDRVVHGNPIAGLDWDADYDYRVRHLRAGVNVGTYQHTFHTRLPTGDTTAFSFAAYGDSAAGNASGFRSVQDRVNQIDPAFTVLLGDNVYQSGTHDESDLRFDASVNPEAAEWIASHIDYLGLGNHDVKTADGQPSEDNFAVPIPVAGVNAHAEPPASERDEHNFSWDYGDVHFVTFDTNALKDASRLDGLLDYVVADLNASTAQWKIVYGHHPIAGVPDKPENPDDYYYQQVVARLKDAGADLFMVGHSHTYSWTYPLTGQISGQATFVEGPYNDFQAGDGLPQLVSGLGGQSPRSGNYSQFPFVAAGYTSSTGVPAELGFALVDVAPNRLTVSYIAADDGATIDSFTITDGPDVTPPAASLSTPPDNGPNDLDPADDAVTVNRRQNEFQIQLSDIGDGIDDATVVGQTISVMKNGGPLLESVDYTFGYDAPSDTLSLTPTAAWFGNGSYVITLNGGGPQIADAVGNTLATTVLSVEIDTTIVAPQTLAFQHNVNGYSGTSDTYLQQADPDANNATATQIIVDGADGGGPVQGLLRFDSIFGDAANRIPVGATIQSASLHLQVTNGGHSLQLHRMLQDWNDTDNWTSLVSGIQTDDVEASSAADAVTDSISTGLLTIDVTASLAAWVGDPAANRGWAVLPTSGNQINYNSAEGTTSPRLVVEFLAPPTNVEPQAVDESYQVDERNPLNVPQPGVLTNDSDDDGDPLTAVLVAGPAHAESFLLSADGSFDYTPLANFNGVDTFTYLANDGIDNSNVATVMIAVNASYTIIDDGDTGYVDTGWAQSPLMEGRLNDLRYAPAGNGSQRATWTFTGLTPGHYRVSATWTAHPNRATDAPFTILNGTGGDALATTLINQEPAPDDLIANGSSWEDLAIVTITGSELVVELSNAANGYVIADAIRIERSLTPPPPPDFLIIDDGETGYADTGWAQSPFMEGRLDDLRYTPAGNGSQRATWTFTGLVSGHYRVWATWTAHPNRATNALFTILDGTGALATSIINQELSPDDLIAGGSAWEELGFVTIIGSEISGADLIVELSDAANEYVIADAIRIERSDTPPPPPEFLIIDDGDTGYADTGWTQSPLMEGRQSDLRYASAGNGWQRATWTFTGLTPGDYRVSATWTAHPNRATNAPFTIYDGIGGDVLEQVLVNQEQAPDDFTSSGSDWEDLAIVTITGSKLVVELSNAANQYVAADAIRIAPPPPGAIIDDGDAGFSTTTGWSTSLSEGRGGDVRYAGPGNGSRIATWTFTGLTAGDYRVSATWSSHANRATNAPYTLFDGLTPLQTVEVNQRLAPDDTHTLGSDWEELMTVEIAGDTLVVQLSNNANGFVIADTIRVQPVM